MVASIYIYRSHNASNDKLVISMQCLLYAIGLGAGAVPVSDIDDAV
jgi:hypothetical protein